MKGPENKLWQRIKRASQARRFEITWDRVESPLTSPGITDLIGTRRGEVHFVELKAGGNFKWRSDQRSWAVRHVVAGGRVWLLAEISGCFYLWKITSIDMCKWDNKQLIQAPHFASGIIDDVLGEIFHA